MLATWGCTTFPKATIDLQFAGATSLDNRITFTRASTATFFNSAGVLTSAAINEARFDYNPSTLAPRGLLIEEARTNSVANNTIVGAAAGTPGTAPTGWAIATSGSGLTREIVGIGTESGIAYIDIKYSGTASASTALSILPVGSIGAVAASSGQVWTNSLWAKVVAGSTSGFSIAMQEFDSGLNFLRGPSTAQALTSTLTRYTQTVTIGASTASIRAGGFISVTNGEVVNITLRIGLPQLELGAFATSVIPTTTIALTRSADVATMTGTNFSSWYNASEGTVFVYSIPSNVTASNFANWAIGDSTLSFGAANTIYNLYTSGLTGRIGVNAITAGASQVSNLTPSYTQNANTLTKSAIAYKLNDYAHSVNGVAPVTDTSATVPTVTSMSIGGLQSGWSGATTYLNGYIQRISYYPVRLPNSTLQALTA